LFQFFVNFVSLRGQSKSLRAFFESSRFAAQMRESFAGEMQ
jgi:hypothetical protein